MKKAITISREFGSGGREIGLRLSKLLDVPFYDKELIIDAANETELSREVVEKYEESVMLGQSFTPGKGLFAFYQRPITDTIYLAQSRVLRELAEAGPCIIVGRCADAVLAGRSINIFVRAELKARVRRKQGMDTDIPPEQLPQHIQAVDKNRKRYYEHYAHQKWGQMEHYHLSIDTTDVELDACAGAIAQYVRGFE